MIIANGISKEILVVKKGGSFIILKITEIALFFYNSGLVFAVDFDGNKYIVEYGLNDLESFLSSKLFFKASRQIILSLNSIREFKVIEHGKIVVELRSADWLKIGQVIISQPTAPLFRQWISNL